VSPAPAGFSATLEAAMRRLLPSATFGPVEVEFIDGTRSVPPFQVVSPNPGEQWAYADIAYGPLVGLFTLQIWPTFDPDRMPGPDCGHSTASYGCEARTGPVGEPVTIRRTIDFSRTSTQVNVYRRDGSVLVATVFNHPAAWRAGTSPEPKYPPPLGADMIIELLLTPTLGLP
jgi:hypothetical protein